MKNLKKTNLTLVSLYCFLSILVAPQHLAQAKKEDKGAKQTNASSRDGNFSVSPAMFDLTCTPGEKKTLALKLTNPMGSQANATISPEGMILNGSGGPAQQPLAALPPNNLARHLIIESPVLTIPPHGYKDVSVTLDIPQGLTGTQYTALATTSTTEAPVAEGTDRSEEYQTRVGLGISPGIVVMIKCKMEGTLKYAYSLVDFKIQPPQGNQPLNVSAMVKNTGNAELSFMAVLILLDAAKNPVARLKSQAGTVLIPGATQEVIMSPSFTKIPPGSYQAVLNLASTQAQLPPTEKSIKISY